MLMHWKSKVGVGKVTSMAQVRVNELLPEYARAGSRSIVHDGVGITCMEHPIFPYPSLSNGPSYSIDLGGLRASPRWRFHS